MMSTHICQSPEMLSWEQIKQCVLGRQISSDRYSCGGCLRTFETICSLHVHCMGHTGGGSYYFNHVTNTAYPKFELKYSASQYDEKDFLDAEEAVFLSLKKSEGTEVVNQPKHVAKSGITVTSDETKARTGIEVGLVGKTDSNQADNTSPDNSDESVSSSGEMISVCLYSVEGSGTSENCARNEAGSQRNHPGDADACVKVNGTSSGIQSNKSEASRKQEIIENLNLTPVDTVHVSKLDKKGHKVVKKDKINGDSIKKLKHNDFENMIKTRPVRKRKLTTRMQESELRDTLKARKINPGIKHKNDENRVRLRKAERKSNVDESDNSDENERIMLTRKEGKVVTGDVIYDLVKDGIKPRKMDRRSNIVGNSINVTEISKSSKIQKDFKVSKDPDPDTKISHVEETELKQGTEENLTDLAQEELCLQSDIDTRSKREKHINNFAAPKKDGVNGLKSGISSNSLQSRKNAEGDSERVDDLTGQEKEDKQEENKYRLKDKGDKDDSSEDQDVSAESISDINLVNADEGKRKERSKRLGVQKIPLYKRNDLICDVCGKVGSMNMIKYHEQMHSNKMLYKCEECGKCFKTAACKRSHVRQHGEKKWKCDQCPAAFFRKQYLEMHMIKHTGEFPYMCELCGMKFKMADIVRRHVNSVHRNIRNYKCNICEKTFFRAATRNQHMKRHFEPHLQCSYCPKKFKADLDLRKHELTHTGEKQFFCPLCNQGFTQIWPYYRHMWKLHSIQKEEAKKIRIKNPDIVNMRNVNKDSGNKEPGYIHEFIGKPGCTFDMRKNFNQNVSRNNVTVEGSESHGEMYVYTDKTGVSTAGEHDNTEVYIETSSELTDAIVLDIGEELGNKETIVIQTEDLENADNQTGYIVVGDSQGGGNIVIYSEFQSSEMEDVKEFSSVDNI